MTAITLYTFAPRLYSRYQRHAKPANFRYSDQRRTFLTAQAARLSSDVATLEAGLGIYTADQIAAAASTDDLPDLPR